MILPVLEGKHVELGKNGGICASRLFSLEQSGPVWIGRKSGILNQNAGEDVCGEDDRAARDKIAGIPCNFWRILL